MQPQAFPQEFRVGPDSDLVVVFVHGTFHAAERYDSEAPAFSSEISGRLAPLRVDYLQFAWSSNNLYSARIAAAKSLAAHIDSARPALVGKRGLVFIGHSHGGNVAMEAMRLLGPLEGCERCVICLGTPLMLARARKDSVRLLIVLALWIASVPVMNILRDGSHALFLLRSGAEAASNAVPGFLLGTLAYIPPLVVCFGPLTLWMILFSQSLGTNRVQREWDSSGMSDARDEDEQHFHYFFDSNDEVAALFRAFNVEEGMAFIVKACSLAWLAIVAYYFLRITELPNPQDVAHFAGHEVLFAFDRAFLEASYVVAFTGMVATVLGWLLLARILILGNRRVGAIQDRLYSAGGANLIDVSGITVTQTTGVKPPARLDLITVSEYPSQPYRKVFKRILIASLILAVLSVVGILAIMLLAGPPSLEVIEVMFLGVVLVFSACFAYPRTRSQIIALYHAQKVWRTHPHTGLKDDPRVVWGVGELIERLFR